MSHAILTLGLQLAPATLHRAGNRNILAWYARCEACGQKSKVHPLMSLALTEHYLHAEMHRIQVMEQREEEAAEQRRLIAKVRAA